MGPCLVSTGILKYGKRAEMWQLVKQPHLKYKRLITFLISLLNAAHRTQDNRALRTRCHLAVNVHSSLAFEAVTHKKAT